MLYEAPRSFQALDLPLTGGNGSFKNYSLDRSVKVNYGGANQQAFAGVIRRVVGPPIIWKELRSPIFRHHKIRTCILAFIGLILLSGTYYLCAKARVLDDEGTHAAYAISES